MISFKQFLNEDSISERLAAIESAANIIKRDCQPFLNVYGGKMLYRGMYVSNSFGYMKPVTGALDTIMYIGAVRADREPRDSPQWLHDAMNKKFVSKVGLPLRSASLFVVGSIDQAENYGQSYMIFPIGDFHYAWSDKTADPTHEFYMNPVQNSSLADSTTSDYMKTIEKQFFAYLKKNYPEAYAASGEKYRYFLAWAEEENIDIADENKSPWIKFVKDFISKNELWKYDEGLQKALSPKFHEHEIMLACDKYYAVNTSKIATATLLKYLKK